MRKNSREAAESVEDAVLRKARVIKGAQYIFRSNTGNQQSRCLACVVFGQNKYRNCYHRKNMVKF